MKIPRLRNGLAVAFVTSIAVGLFAFVAGCSQALTVPQMACVDAQAPTAPAELRSPAVASTIAKVCAIAVPIVTDVLEAQAQGVEQKAAAASADAGAK